MQPGVTIIVPVHDRRQLVTRCLDSVLAQTVSPARLIVVDNGSTDGSAEAVEDWIERHGKELGNKFDVSLLSEPERGACNARNRGLQEADTEYVIFFDSDDEMHPDLVERALQAADGSRKPDIVCWQGEVIGIDGHRRLKPFHADNLLRRHFYNGLLSTQCFMARTSLVRRAGGWDPRAAAWNDWELGIRLIFENPEVAYIHKVLVTIHSQAESITGLRFSDKAGIWENTLDIVEERVLASGREDRQQLLDMTDYRRAILAACYRREGAPHLAAPIIDKALKRPGRKKRDALLLKWLYTYTTLGGRAAYYLWR